MDMYGTSPILPSNPNPAPTPVPYGTPTFYSAFTNMQQQPPPQPTANSVLQQHTMNSLAGAIQQISEWHSHCVTCE